MHQSVELGRRALDLVQALVVLLIHQGRSGPSRHHPTASRRCRCRCTSRRLAPDELCSLAAGAEGPSLPKSKSAQAPPRRPQPISLLNWSRQHSTFPAHGDLVACHHPPVADPRQAKISGDGGSGNTADLRAGRGVLSSARRGGAARHLCGEPSIARRAKSLRRRRQERRERSKEAATEAGEDARDLSGLARRLVIVGGEGHGGAERGGVRL